MKKLNKLTEVSEQAVILLEVFRRIAGENNHITGAMLSVHNEMLEKERDFSLSEQIRNEMDCSIFEAAGLAAEGEICADTLEVIAEHIQLFVFYMRFHSNFPTKKNQEYADLWAVARSLTKHGSVNAMSTDDLLSAAASFEVESPSRDVKDRLASALLHRGFDIGVQRKVQA